MSEVGHLSTAVFAFGFAILADLAAIREKPKRAFVLGALALVFCLLYLVQSFAGAP